MLFLLGLKCLIKPNHQAQFGSFIHSLADRLHGDHYICHVWKPKWSNKNVSDRNKTFALCSFVIFMFLIFEPSVTKENLWLKTCQQSFIASFIDIKQSLRHSFHLPTLSILSVIFSLSSSIFAWPVCNDLDAPAVTVDWCAPLSLPW